MISACVWRWFTVSQEDHKTANCKTCGAKFQRWGKKRESFYTSNMMTHLRNYHRHDHVWKENQEAKLLKRSKRVKPGEEEMEENDEKQPGPSTTLSKEEANGKLLVHQKLEEILTLENPLFELEHRPIQRPWTVTCGHKTGLLDISKLRQSIECIKCEGQWFAPSAFEVFGGRKSSKKWKSTIFYKDKPLQYWFEQGYLSTKGFHKRSVDCLKETTNLQSDVISEHLSDGNLAATTVSNSPAGSPGEPDSSLCKDSWCQPLDTDMLIEEDCPPTNIASSPAVEGPTSPGLDVAREVEPTQSSKGEDVEMREIQCVTGEGIAAVKSQGTKVENENIELQQTQSEKSTASDAGVPESTLAPSPPASAGCDLDTMDLQQLKREKLKMQIKVLRLQEEYYTRKLGGPLT